MFFLLSLQSFVCLTNFGYLCIRQGRSQHNRLKQSLAAYVFGFHYFCKIFGCSQQRYNKTCFVANLFLPQRVLATDRLCYLDYMQQVKAKKYLGQHFLTDLDVARRIAETLPVGGEGGRMPVLEIGPGMGVLTQFLLKNPDIELTAVEIDSESVEYLHDNFPDLRVVEGDFLRLDIDSLIPDGRPFMVIGNYPYNISSQIFFRVLEFRDRIPVCSGMIQKEVAERIAAPAGSKTYGITSVLLQAFYDIEYLFTVHEHVFNPPPKVKSAVIRMTRNSCKHLPCDEKLFIQVVKTAFNQRRKTMRNSLRPITGGRPLSESVFDRRPEQLSVSDFIDLTNLVQKILSQPPSL